MRAGAFRSRGAGASLGVLVFVGLFAFPPSLPGAAATPAPRFAAKDLRGKTLDLDQLVRKGPVLLDFWATWCKPCLQSLPELEAWHQEYGPRGLTVIGISLDGPRNQAKVRPFAQRLGLTYPIVVDLDGRIQERYQVIALPTAVLIDTVGTVAAVRVGYRPGEGKKLVESLRALLKIPAAADSASDSAEDSDRTGSTPDREP